MRFDFRRIGLDDLNNHLIKIAKKEGIVINQEAISLIAKHSQGGLRDAESLLDQVSLLPPPITEANIVHLIGAVPEEELIRLAKSLTNKDPNTILNICNNLVNKGKEPIAILQGIASILRDLVIVKVASDQSNLCNISKENIASIKDLANSIHIDQILNLQAKLKGSENHIRNSNQPKLWLEIHLLGMLSNDYSKLNTDIKQTLIKTTSSKNSEIDYIEKRSEESYSNKNEDLIKENTNDDKSKLIRNENLDDIWQKTIAMLELPSTKMLLSQQARLINCNSDSAEIAISEKWINMIQSRKNLIEDAFYKSRGIPTKVILVQQKDNLSNKKDQEKIIKEKGDINESRIKREINKNDLEDQKIIQDNHSLDTNSIDNKAKQFAEFFNGEIVNLE
tara:strand:- start:679 stop:1857 length:1179 start_codon:yes stop_codon:yes gene_type:complete